MTWGGRGHTAVVIFTAQRFRENADLTLLRPNNSKKSPINPPWFLTADFSTLRPISEWFRFWQKLFAADENGDKKIFFFKRLLTCKAFFSNFFFLLVSSVNLFEVYCKKEKSRKLFFLHTKNGGVRLSGYTCSAGCIVCCCDCGVRIRDLSVKKPQSVVQFVR